jgi:cytosine/adenosine deaminase-related metal-dependent hydrolase
MAYRKLKADTTFTGTHMLSDHVLITTESGSIIDLIETAEAGDDIEPVEGLLCPGFVNAHCHIELSHMKGIIPEQTGMVPFLLRVMFERQAEETIKQQAIQQAVDEMYRNGIVAVGDTCNTTDSLSTKSASHQFYFHNFIEASGFVPGTANIRIDRAMHTANKFLAYYPPQQVSITPHAPYSVSQKLFQQITDHTSSIISIHNQESQAEEDFIRNKTGEMLRLFQDIGVNIDFFQAHHRSSLNYMLPMLPKAAPVILVHNCYTTKHDIDILLEESSLRNTQYYFCLCPNANLYIGNPLPAISHLIQSEIPICIGTDSLASNNQLNVLAELQTLQKRFPFISLNMLLQWGTLNGAKALQIDNRFGSFKKGKKPGVLQIKNVAGDQLHRATINRII